MINAWVIRYFVKGIDSYGLLLALGICLTGLALTYGIDFLYNKFKRKKS